MMIGIPVRSCFFVLLVVGMIRATPGQTPNLETFKRDWEYLEKACQRRSIQFTLTNPASPKSGKRPLPQSGQFLADGESSWLSVQDYTIAPPQHELVYGMHRGYSFRLLRRKSDGPWLLRDLGKIDAAFLNQFDLDTNGTHSCCVPWGALFKSLPRWLNDPGFQLKSVRTEVRDASPVVLLECSYSPAKGGTNFFFDTAVVKLDPANKHRVTAYEGKSDGVKIFGKVDYAANDGDLPVVSRYTMTMESKTGTATWVCDYSEWSYPKQPIPENQLGLTAFGITEPKWAKRPPPSRAWMWIGAALAASVALAALFFWLRRRAVIGA
jgi:hypothetical protein